MKVTEQQVDELIAQSRIRSAKMGEKTTVVHLTLPNGFEVVETAACVDPYAYDHEIGEKIALNRVREKIWLLEGYLLQDELNRQSDTRSIQRLGAINIPQLYNQKFIDHVKQTGKPFNDASRYDITIIPANVQPGGKYWRVVGIHHLTGEENHGQHNLFCDVLDEQGQRLHGTRINILTNGAPRGTMIIDKPDNEAGTNTQMHWNDTLTVFIDRDGLPSEQAAGFHTRWADEEGGTTRGHHSYYVVWQEAIFGSVPPPEPPDEPGEPGEPPVGDWRGLFDEGELNLIKLIQSDVDLSRAMTDIIKKFATWADGPEE